MKYISLKGQAPKASFQQAVINGIAPDKGLYFPESIAPIGRHYIQHIADFSDHDLAFQFIKQFVGEEIGESDLKRIIVETLNFPFPLVPLKDDVYSLELFHGPTMAFKDVGARFMARCLAHFNRHESGKDVTVLVATSGDTGGAVASGFLGVKGVNVIILYPKGKVSDVQEKQLTTLGQNITALEVDGNFDDCQNMVKDAFLDSGITDKITLTSANSINVARWLPQMFYYILAYKQLQNKDKPLVVSIPSGNFGNICAGMMAQQLGLPINQFIASTNQNAVVPHYLKTGEYKPQTSVATISNAMDVGNPSNFVRIQRIYGNQFNHLKQHLKSYSFTDDETRAAMQAIYQSFGYIADPHGAVGYLGLEKFLKNNSEFQGIFLETAHPVKFLEHVEPIIEKKLDLPSQIQSVINKKKQAISISNYDMLKAFLLD